MRTVALVLALECLASTGHARRIHNLNVPSHVYKELLASAGGQDAKPVADSLTQSKLLRAGQRSETSQEIANLLLAPNQATGWHVNSPRLAFSKAGALRPASPMRVSNVVGKEASPPTSQTSQVWKDPEAVEDKGTPAANNYETAEVAALAEKLSEVLPFHFSSSSVFEDKDLANWLQDKKESMQEAELEKEKVLESLRNDIPQLLRKEPDWSIFTEDFKVMDNCTPGKTNANTVEGLRTAVLMLKLLRWMSEKLDLREDIKVELNSTDPKGALSARWEIQVGDKRRLALWSRPINIEIEMVFHLNDDNKVDYVLVNKCLAAGLELPSYPEVALPVREMEDLREERRQHLQDLDNLDEQLVLLRSNVVDANADRENSHNDYLSTSKSLNEKLQYLDEVCDKWRVFSLATSDSDISVVKDSFDEEAAKTRRILHAVGILEEKQTADHSQRLQSLTQNMQATALKQEERKRKLEKLIFSLKETLDGDVETEYNLQKVQEWVQKIREARVAARRNERLQRAEAKEREKKQKIESRRQEREQRIEAIEAKKKEKQQMIQDRRKEKEQMIEAKKKEKQAANKKFKEHMIEARQHMMQARRKAKKQMIEAKKQEREEAKKQYKEHMIAARMQKKLRVIDAKKNDEELKSELARGEEELKAAFNEAKAQALKSERQRKLAAAQEEKNMKAAEGQAAAEAAEKREQRKAAVAKEREERRVAADKKHQEQVQAARREEEDRIAAFHEASREAVKQEKERRRAPKEEQKQLKVMAAKAVIERRAALAREDEERRAVYAEAQAQAAMQEKEVKRKMKRLLARQDKELEATQVQGDARKTLNMLRNDVSQILHEEPHWDLFAENFQVIDKHRDFLKTTPQVDPNKVHSLQDTARLLHLLHRVCKKFDLREEVTVDFNDTKAFTRSLLPRRAFSVHWKVQLRGAHLAGILRKPINLEAEMVFHLDDKKEVDYVRLDKVLANGQELDWPDVDLSSSDDENLKTIEEWIHMLRNDVFSKLKPVRNENS